MLVTSTRHGRARRISLAAHDPIASLGVGAGAVIGVYQGAVNIATPAGLLTLVTEAAGDVPGGIVVEGDDLRVLGLRPGMTVVVAHDRLAIAEAGVVIQLSGAAAWSPRLTPIAGGARAGLRRWRRRSAVVWRFARASGGRGGLAPLLDPAGGMIESLWLPSARAAMAALADGIRRQDADAAALAADQLIGLGEGATPSGDDALVGIEAVLRALGDPMAGFVASALDDVDQRTTAVSAAQLRHAARGDFAARVHELMTALLAETGDGGDADATLAAAIERTTSWGATSGTDGLVGVLWALDAIVARDVALARSA